MRYANIACLSHDPATVESDSGVDSMRRHWRDRLEAVLVDEPDLIILPENCDLVAPASNREQLTQRLFDRGEKMRDFFAEVAAAESTYIAYSSCRLATDGAITNSVQIIGRGGLVEGTYDKNFLTARECQLGLRHGTGLPVFTLDFGTVAPAICFDMQFEELRRARAEQRPDLILFSSEYHGGVVQAAWAFQSRAYFAGAVLPPAPSSVLTPVGDVLGESNNYRHDVTRTVNFDAVVLSRGPNVHKFQDIKRKYRTGVRLHNPGRLGAVLLTSEREEFSAEDVVSEFELETIDSYHARMRAARRDAQAGDRNHSPVRDDHYAVEEP